LFCNTVQPLLLSLSSELTLGYLDDFTLGGNVATVSRIVELGSKMDLNLKAAKCELVAQSGLVVDDPLFRTFTRVEPGDAALLRALMGQWINPQCVFAVVSAGKFLNVRATSLSLIFYSSGSVCSFNVSTPFFSRDIFYSRRRRVAIPA